jgi:hypothetical protein
MVTKIWGPKYWKLFHVISALYPNDPNENDIKMARIFLKSIGEIIPCPTCAQHYKDNFLKFSIKDGLKSKEKFINWFIQFHNFVSQSIGKTPIAFKFAKQKVNQFSKNNRIIDLLDSVLFYAKHVLPEKGIAPINKKNGLTKFIKSCLYFGKINTTTIQLNFQTRNEFVMVHSKMVNKIKKFIR